MLSVVAAAHNEEGNIIPFCKELSSALSGLNHEILIVDDGSTDGTWKEIRKASGRNIRSVRLDKRCGKCFALYRGIMESGGSIIATIDADMQSDPADIKPLMDALIYCDMACGFREERSDGIVKIITSRIANAFNRIIMGVSIHDNACPLKVFRRECISSLSFISQFHRFLPFMAMKQGFVVREFPVRSRPRVRGASKYGILDRFFESIIPVVKLRLGWRGFIS